MRGREVEMKDEQEGEESNQLGEVVVEWCKWQDEADESGETETEEERNIGHIKLYDRSEEK